MTRRQTWLEWGLIVALALGLLSPLANAAPPPGLLPGPSPRVRASERETIRHEVRRERYRERRWRQRYRHYTPRARWERPAWQRERLDRPGRPHYYRERRAF